MRCIMPPPLHLSSNASFDTSLFVEGPVSRKRLWNSLIKFRTTSVNSIFEVSRYLSEKYGHKKSGTLSKKELDSTIVGAERFELPTPWV